MLDFVHFLHILSGIVWAGGAIFATFVVEPTLLRLEAPQMRSFQAAMGRYAGPVMAGSGLLLLVTGFARARLGGAITSFADLSTAYGLYVIAAFVIVILVTVLGGRHRAKVAAALEASDDPRVELTMLWRGQALVTGVGLLATIAIMAILGMGLY
ncbi:MAG TPA: DUF2269 family protein [Rhizobiaceae bacterium]|nr:DUF2269 family protein [Rhizobiaceae bacterium]